MRLRESETIDQASRFLGNRVRILVGKAFCPGFSDFPRMPIGGSSGSSDSSRFSVWARGVVSCHEQRSVAVFGVNFRPTRS
jgi:hypothetical protein